MNVVYKPLQTNSSILEPLGGFDKFISHNTERGKCSVFASL